MSKELITAFQNKEKAELLLANLEKLYSDNTIKEASYNILKSEYSVALKNAQSKIDSIKQELNKILRTRTHELDVYKQELAHMEARFKVGQFTADTYLKQARNPRKKVSDLTDQVSYLSSLINATQSADIPTIESAGVGSILSSLGNIFKSHKETTDSFDLLFPAVVPEEYVAQAEKHQVPDTVNVSNLCILPDRVLPGSSVGVIATIINTGSETVLHKTEFKINNVTQSTNEITLSPGQCEELTFMMTAGVPGDYYISIDNVTGTLHVLPGSNPATSKI
ncbi:MAG: hypothetical protein PHO26_03905 [Dehalococcoidia bacterium]|nr:hypothetical protein [Dehalococcoidia bacterium]MDD5493623.1 hypothetical protein [Dehalococcoidia bacterium]